MIYCGTDIIEIKRIEKSIEKYENFIKKVFTKKEIEYCESKKNQKYQHYAARFAGKEATFKAISKLIENKYEIEWKDIEIINEKNSRPLVNLNDNLKFKNRIKNIDISISHSKEYAIANTIIELGE